jgi:phosphate-selective porin OprO/OprP
LSFSNAVLDQRMTWAAGIFADTDDGGEFFSNKRDFDLASRITGLPLYEDNGRWLIHLGFSGAYNFRNDITVRFRQRPEVHIASRYIDTGDFQSDGSALIAAEVAGVFGPVHVEAEWKQAWHDQAGGKDLTLYGAYVSAGWFITGESRPYKKSRGTWAAVKPQNPFDPNEGKWGAFEVASRYSYINLNSHNLNGGKEQNVTVGLNWYLYSNVRLSANYVYADVRSTGENVGDAGLLGKQRGDIHTFQARAQIVF